MDSRASDRSDDPRGRIGAHASLSDPQFSYCNDGCIYCSGGGVVDDQLRPAQVYGHAVLARGVSGGGGRSTGVFDGDIDREFVTEVNLRLLNSDGNWETRNSLSSIKKSEV